MLEVREARGPFGRFCRALFWIFQALCLLVMLATCSLVPNYLANPDPEVAMGAGLFGVTVLGMLWALWPAGSLVLGLLMLFTRGRRRLIPAQDLPRRAGSVPETGPRPRG
jgi:uncharacterized membrane protein YhaH (DUF805 family)